MNKLYLPDGWINSRLLIDSPAPFVIAIGGRGIGKTYGILNELLKDNEPFIYLRRTQVQIDTCKVQELSPFTAVCRDNNMIIESRTISKYVAGFVRVQGESEKIVAIGLALSTFANVRGFDASVYKYVLFDEFIPEKHERPISHEGEAFLNVLETINRNRELKNISPAKVIMLSNANKLDSPILEAIGALSPLDKMTIRGKEWGRFYNGDLEIFRFTDSPISRRKKDTALYRLSKSEDFNLMSIENSFGADSYYNVKSLPLKEFSPVAATKGITVCKHKSEPIYYIVAGHKTELIFSDTPEQQREFCRKTVNAYNAMCKGKVFYSSAPVKVIFENIWR